jgi:hypothetical protein
MADGGQPRALLEGCFFSFENRVVEMSGVAGRSGRKKFVPTPNQRDIVTVLASRGIPREHICQLITNPQTGKPLSVKTLVLAFVSEIMTGEAQLKLRIGRFMIDTILGHTPVDAKPIR